ncbi:MAG: hydrolase 1, exosortase A system-associated [Pseudomonadota bacterium]
MSVREIPVVFDCEGSELVGMVHLPARVSGRGMLSIVAGGPQYRGGVCRMQVQMARHLADAGIPVMRFDYRGLGDSEGRFRGFQDVAADLGAAIQAFRAQVPGLQEVVLWGGCDAASAVLINAWRYPEVTGVVLGNPWVHNPGTGDAVAVKHYGQRMRDKDFWLKVLRLQYNPLPALATLLRRTWTRLAGGGSGTAGSVVDAPDAPFVPRMRHGLQQFKGDVLFLMSGRSLLSREFDELMATDPAWQQAARSPRLVARHDIPEGDQAFSTLDTRTEVNRVTRQWMLDARALAAAPAATGPQA